MILSIIFIIIKLVASLLIADFVTGMFHWLEDTYNIPFGDILCHNRLHHIKPYEMTKYTTLETITSTLYFAIPLMLLNYFFIKSQIMMISLVFMTFANQIHKLSHYPTKMIKSKTIHFLQRTGIFQSKSHHHIHHSETTKYYCVMTNYLNPFLEYINFWRRIEYFIQVVFGIYPRTKSDHDVVNDCIKKKIIC